MKGKSHKIITISIHNSDKPLVAPSDTEIKEEKECMKYLILWILGVPVGVLVVLWVIGQVF